MRKLLPAALLCAVVFVSCRKEHGADVKDQFINNETTINVTIDESHPGAMIPQTFEGLSFETSILAEDAGFLNADNKVLIQMMKNLGPGILRMGGASSDLTTWTGTARSADTPPASVTTTDIDHLSAFATATGWPVLFGLNLGNNDKDLAANEAAYVKHSLGDNLYAFQSGNEPDAYGPYTHHRNGFYSFNDFLSEWRSYKDVVEAAAPGAMFAGPDVAFNHSWISPFADNEGQNIRLLDGHYYEGGPATEPGITVQYLLNNETKLMDLIESFQGSPASKTLPYRITECNNIYGGGKHGVSDVFASALWALNTMWTSAANGCEGINFHTGIGLYYSPVMKENGILVAKPEYYAMLAFRYASTNARPVPTKIDKDDYCNAYTSMTGNTYYFTLVNRSMNKNFDFNIIPSKKLVSIKVNRLKAPAVDAATGITFGGSTVNADGTFNITSTESFNNDKSAFIVHVPAGSAAVVTAE